MFSPQKAMTALHKKEEYFNQYSVAMENENRRSKTIFARFRGEDLASLLGQIDELDEEWPGALPTPDVDRADGMCIPFGESWANRQEALAWALSTLYGRTTVAVDGSQITPTKDFSVPVGAVQIGWFINHHREAGENGDVRYIKDVDFEVLAPDELQADHDDDRFPTWRVNEQRFVLECEKICELIEDSSREQGEESAGGGWGPTLFFFDGSLIISFAGQLRPGRDVGYINAVKKLIDCSERHRAPLVGFVDSAYSRDVVTLINSIYEDAQLLQLSDAHFFQNFLLDWGDRSPFFICARPDALSRSGKGIFYKRVAFCYVRLVQNLPPARLEMPRWLLEAGLADKIVDLVRAESIVGQGYPYSIETADVTAVIQQQDRQRFYRLFQQFLADQQIQLDITRKMSSKRGRR